MKQIFDKWVILAMVIIVIAGFWGIYQPTDKATGAAENFSYARKTFSGMTGETPNWYSATNNNLLWIGNATTTTEFVMDVENVGSVSFNLFTKGTTTVSSNTVTAVNWQLEFTQASSTTKGAWFGEDVESTSGASVTHKEKFHYYDSGTTASSSVQIRVDDINAKSMRLLLSAGTTTAPYLGVWVEAIYKKGN